MEYKIEKYGTSVLQVTVAGRIDLDSAVELGTSVRDQLDEIKELIIDFNEVTFISSFGLKIILELYKQMQKQGSMKIRNASETIKNSFKMVGFDKFLSID